MKPHFFPRFFMQLGFGAVLVFVVLPLVYVLFAPDRLNTPEAFAEFYTERVYSAFVALLVVMPVALLIRLRGSQSKGLLTTATPSAVLLPAGGEGTDRETLGRQLREAGFEEVASGQHYRNGSGMWGLNVQLEDYKLGQHPFLRVVITSRASFTPWFSPFTKPEQEGLIKLKKVLAATQPQAG